MTWKDYNLSLVLNHSLLHWSVLLQLPELLRLYMNGSLLEY